MKPKSIFFVFMCKHCGNIQVRELRLLTLDLGRRTLKCFRCMKSTTIKTRRSYGINMSHRGPFADVGVAGEVCRKWKLSEREGGLLSFKSYSYSSSLEDDNGTCEVYKKKGENK